jgi:hypothetical protein
MGFPGYGLVFYIFIINVYNTTLKNPPLAFGVREGRGVAVLTQKRIQNPSTHI